MESRSESNANLTEPSQSSAAPRVLVILVAVVGVVAVVAVIVSAVSLSRPSVPNVTVQGSTINAAGAPAPAVAYVQPANPTGDGSTESDKKIWTLCIGHDFGAYTYIGPKGYLAGFNHDLIAAVCNEAGIDCRTIWDKGSNCWDSSAGMHSRGGKGLMGGWYDACTGWYNTVDRIQVYSFSQPWIKPVLSYLYAKEGSNFDFKNITGKKIGFVDGWASDEKCLARWTAVKGNVLPPNNVVHQPTPGKLREMLLNDEINAVFATERDMDSYKEGLVVSPTTFSCMIAGTSMMAKKDSEFPSLWNVGFQKLVSNGKFAKMCKDAETTHGWRGQLNCIDS